MTLRRAIPGLLAGALLLATGCESITGPKSQGATWSKVALDERVTDAFSGFGFELFRRLRAAEPDANIFASPTSAALALAMTYNGAAGQTAEEMARVLGVADIPLDALNETNRKWIEALQRTGDPRAELAIASSVWYRDWYPITDAFRERVEAGYAAEILPITTAAEINRWVDRATRGRIDEIIEGEIPRDMVAYLINAVYFKADWTYRFDERNTRPAPFHRADGSTVQVPMMYQVGAFDVRYDDRMAMLRLPYGAGRYSMVLALPTGGAGLAELAERLEAGRWREWMAEFRENPELEVRLPRFEIEWKSSLVETLAAMGMVAPFDPNSADFSEMFGTGGTYIDEVLQKTFLRVDEKGTEAAAVTSVGVRVTSAIDRNSITFDRPFFLAIWDHATETVLFLGQIMDPTA